MSKDDPPGDEHPHHDSLNKLLLRLQLPFIRANYHELAQTAAEQHWDHLEYLKCPRVLGWAMGYNPTSTRKCFEAQLAAQPSEE